MTCTDQAADRQQMGVYPQRLHSCAPGMPPEAVRGSLSDFQRFGDGFDQFGQRAVKSGQNTISQTFTRKSPETKNCGNLQKFHHLAFNGKFLIDSASFSQNEPCFCSDSQHLGIFPQNIPFQSILPLAVAPVAVSRKMQVIFFLGKCKSFFSTEKCKLFFSGKMQTIFYFGIGSQKNANDFYFRTISEKCKRFFPQKKKSH